jgi:endonuclease G
MNIYENHWKIPRYTIHTLEAKLLSLDKYPRSNNFREDKRLPEEYRSKLSDYKGSGYDRGHNVPNGNRNYDPNLMDETFLLSNMAPQGKAANQSAMESVESHVREEVKHRGFALVYTGSAIDEEDSKTIGKSKVFVPKYLFKIACYPNNYEEAFLIENLNSGLKKNYMNYLTSIQKINQLTNLEFSCGTKY